MKRFILFLTFSMSLVFCLAQSDTLTINDDLQLVHIKDSIFAHVSWVNSEQYGRFSCNGLLIIRGNQAVMIDTPMSVDQTEELCDFILGKWGAQVMMLIAGHYHDDCIGGLDYLHEQGAQSLASMLTVAKCEEDGLPIPTIEFESEYDFRFEDIEVECRFFGGGHSFDNITVWLPKQCILFGGCLVKSAQSRGLGDLADAVINDWIPTIQKVQYAYPEVETVIPGHGNIGGADLLDHTISLVTQYQNK